MKIGNLAQVFPVDAVNGAYVTTIRMDLVAWAIAILGAWLVVHGLFWIMDLMDAREDKARADAQAEGVRRSMSIQRFNNRFDERWK